MKIARRLFLWAAALSCFLLPHKEKRVKKRTQPRLFLIGGAADQTLKDLVALSGGGDSHIVILPHASSIWNEVADKVTRQLLAFGAGRVSVVRPHVDRDIPEDATCLFMTGGDQVRLVKLLADFGLTDKVRSMSQRGVLVAGTSAGTHAVAKVMIAGGMSDDKTLRRGAVLLAKGLAFLPHNVITDSHYGNRQRENRSRAAIASLPWVMTSIGIDEDTALYVTEEQCTIFGVGSVALIQRSSRKPSRRLTGEARWLAVAQEATVTSYVAGDKLEL